ncbi:MAG: alpha-galactosidase [Lentisphaeria bacterium]|nr:alpha-galactosidase [Lentisphaeria bacterium]
MSFKEATGNWSVEYESDKSRLVLRHEKCEIEMAATLSMTVGDQAWSVKEPMDAVKQRLALVSPDNSVQGYLTFSGEGGRLEIRAIHRTAQFYAGVVKFSGTVKMRDVFACCVTPSEKIHVVRMGSGMADSLTNDALFDRERDRCLSFTGAKALSLKTIANGEFSISCELPLTCAAKAGLVVSLVENYYRDRYIPYYKPIDRKRCPAPPTGWMSWNVYFDQAGAAENLAEARVGAKELKPFGMEYWSIESWQGDSDKLPVSSFDNLSLKSHKTQFPDGMAKLAEDIRAIGFKPGIWTAPFGTGSKEFYEAHKDWFLHGEGGQPLRTWNGVYTIDPSNDDVIAYLRDIHRKMAQDWGYEFFKIDGMSGRGPGYCAHFYERPEVRARFKNPDCPNPFERCVNAFREGIGPGRVFLACQGHYTGPEAGLADASRIGGDIVAPNTNSNWNNIMSQARATLNQLFVHNIVFFMDPDTLLVGEYHPLEEARVTATVVALPGQMMFAGDKLAELPPERMRLLQQALPVCDVHPLDMYPVFEMSPVWDLKVKRPFGEWDVVALFNWSNEEAEVGFTFGELGLDSSKFYAIYEFWTDEFQDIYENEFSMSVPAHGVRLLAVHEEQARPQFLSSDRHLTQGAVDLEDLSWDAKRKELCGKVKLVGGHPTQLAFLLSDNYALQKVSAKDADMALKVDRDGVLRVTLISAKDVTAEFHVKVEDK